jgi:hypothetical protein
MSLRNSLIGMLIGWSLGFSGQVLTDCFCWSCGARTTFEWMESLNEINFSCFPKQEVSTFKGSYHRYLVLVLLLQRGDVATRTAMIVVFLGASSIVGAEKLRNKWAANKVITAS